MRLASSSPGVAVLEQVPSTARAAASGALVAAAFAGQPQSDDHKDQQPRRLMIKACTFELGRRSGVVARGSEMGWHVAEAHERWKEC
jgi:hypothetical protein